MLYFKDRWVKWTYFIYFQFQNVICFYSSLFWRKTIFPFCGKYCNEFLKRRTLKNIEYFLMSDSKHSWDKAPLCAAWNYCLDSCSSPKKGAGRVGVHELAGVITHVSSCDETYLWCYPWRGTTPNAFHSNFVAAYALHNAFPATT